MPLQLYIVSFCLGGVFLAASLLLGGGSGDADAEFDADVPAGNDAFDAGVDAEGALDGGDAAGDAAGEEFGGGQSEHLKEELWDHGRGTDGHGVAGMGLAWFPLTSMRFWVFFLSFFGLTGLALDGGGLLESTPAGAVSAVFGYLIGVGAVNVLRQARRGNVSSLVTADELIGKVATVTVPIDAGRAGKILVETRSGDEEYVAIAGKGMPALARNDRARIERFEGTRAVVSALKG